MRRSRKTDGRPDPDPRPEQPPRAQEARRGTVVLVPPAADPGTGPGADATPPAVFAPALPTLPDLDDDGPAAPARPSRPTPAPAATAAPPAPAVPTVPAVPTAPRLADPVGVDDLERGRSVAVLAAIGRMQLVVDLLERRLARAEERIAELEAPALGVPVLGGPGSGGPGSGGPGGGGPEGLVDNDADAELTTGAPPEE